MEQRPVGVVVGRESVLAEVRGQHRVVRRPEVAAANVLIALLEAAVHNFEDALLELVFPGDGFFLQQELEVVFLVELPDLPEDLDLVIGADLAQQHQF